MFVGSQPYSGRVWNPGVKITQLNHLVPSEDFIVDPILPVLGTDPRFQTDQIVIPRGRIISLRADTTAYTGKACLTLANGSTNPPAGYAEANILRKFEERFQYMPLLSKNDFIELPYVAAVNAAQGALSGGMKLMAFSGSATATAGVANNIGKPVKWIERRVALKNQASNVASTLSAATYPGYGAPTVIMAWATGTVIATGSSVTPAWTGSAWVATFGNPVTDVLYEYGASSTQIAGEVYRIEPISAAHELSGWLKWVTDNFLAWEYPPQLMRVPTTDVTLEVPNVVSAPLKTYQIANYPIAPWKTITVNLTGTVVSPAGVSTSYTGEAMSVASVPMMDYTMGEYYQINPITGLLTLSNNVTVTAITVSYSYETSYRDGRIWAPGVQQLTDGTYSGVPGTPANLEISGVAGSLRCIIY